MHLCVCIRKMKIELRKKVERRGKGREGGRKGRKEGERGKGRKNTQTHIILSLSSYCAYRPRSKCNKTSQYSPSLAAELLF